VVAVSKTIADRIVERDASLSPRLSTIPYGVAWPSSVPVRPEREALRLLYTGRLEQSQKRVGDLVDLAALLKQRGLRFQLDIIGSGPARPMLAERIAAMGLTSCVVLHGTVSPDAVGRLSARADVFLLMSAFEGLPLSLLEGMSQGCVPVVADVDSGVPELIEDGTNGFRVAVGRIDRFADRIMWLADSSGRRRAMGINAWQTIDRNGYRLEVMVTRYATLLASVFDEIQRGTFTRSNAPLAPPPHLTWKDRVLAPVWPLTQR
jgi:glycosyltransferase involved in cell wall biosynthesis